MEYKVRDIITLHGLKLHGQSPSSCILMFTIHEIQVYTFLLDCKEYRMSFNMYLYLIMNCNSGGLIILVTILVVINSTVKLSEGYMHIDLQSLSII